MEFWPSGKEREIQKAKEAGTVDAVGLLGVQGQSGQYTAPYLVHEYPVVSEHADQCLGVTYKAFEAPTVLASMPRGSTGTRCTMDYCTKGAFIPEQCRAPDANCAESWKVSPFWDQGYNEDLIETFGLNLTVQYLSNYSDRIEGLMAESSSPRKPFFFYGWVPDPFIAKHNFPRVLFPKACV